MYMFAHKLGLQQLTAGGLICGAPCAGGARVLTCAVCTRVSECVCFIECWEASLDSSGYLW